MSGQESSSGRTAAYFSPEAKKQALWWTIAAVSAPIAGAAVWWLSETAINRLAPPEYHYRPGTVSEYISDLLAKHAKRQRRRKPMRVYMDGCFDVMHYGHANALRQARALGDELVVGLISDDEIRAAKGPPVQNYEERKTLVGAVKWVDEIIDDAPYLLSPDFLHELFTKHRIDYVVHGDDPCLLPDGTDAYAYAKQQKRFLMIKRTEGVSSTDIVGRMLMCTRDNARFREERRELTKQFSSGERRVVLDQLLNGSGDASSGSAKDEAPRKPAPPQHTTISRFMPTSRRIVQFSDGVPAPPGARIVYIDGAFDLFHPGHVEILKLARAQGDFLLVGLHTDEAVSERRGAHLPIMDLHERALSVLACRYVNEVIIGAPGEVTEDLLTTFNINLVVRGTVSETAAEPGDVGADAHRYGIPQTKGVFRTLSSPSAITTATIIARIVANRAQYEARNARKNKSEAAYYKAKQHVNEV